MTIPVLKEIDQNLNLYMRKKGLGKLSAEDKKMIKSFRQLIKDFNDPKKSLAEKMESANEAHRALYPLIKEYGTPQKVTKPEAEALTKLFDNLTTVKLVIQKLQDAQKQKQPTSGKKAFFEYENRPSPGKVKREEEREPELVGESRSKPSFKP